MRNMKLWWKRLEEEPSEKRTVKEFLEECNFTWKPISQPCYQKVGDEYKVIPNHQISVRSDNLYPIAVVKDRYKLLTNEECFSMGNRFLEIYPNAKFISCGDIMNFSESYLSMILKTVSICGDEFGVWLTFTNGFDGRNATNATVSLIRIKDHNVFQYFDENHPRVWTMGRVNVKTDFIHIHEDIEMYIKYAQELCEKMKSKEIILNEVVGEIIAIDWKKTRRVNKNLAVIKEYAREIYMKNNGKTLYDLFFAFADYYHNYPRMRIDKLGDDKRFQLAMIKYNYELYDYHTKMLTFLN